jgi:glycosyltransferase involved in cell wall biosynthesis
MRIGLVAPPFIPVPPKEYGGTELFIAHLAEALKQRGLDAVVYTNGESTVGVEKRWIFEDAQWPPKKGVEAQLRQAEHDAWAIHDAATTCDLVHLNSFDSLPFTKFIQQPIVCTLHHPHEPVLSAFYQRYPDVQYVSISHYQQQQEPMPRNRTIHHGIDLTQYRLQENKQQYVSFIGRIAPVKGTHSAITVAQRAGIPLKIAGEVQPAFRDYFEQKIKPQVDGKFIEYIGPADLNAKNELLGNSMAMLFPIQWNEPFGLVMVEAMACGTPVLALRGGSVPEVVRDGVSGYICRSVKEMAKRIPELRLAPASIRGYVEENFSLEKMVEQYANLYSEILLSKTNRTQAA